MALTHKLCLQLSKFGKRNLFRALGNNFQNFLSVVHYSADGTSSSGKLSKAMEAHLETVVKHDKFMKEQLEEYELGKKFLAGMMGKKSQEMTQKDVDEAIEYLFPSALYVPKSRPMLKPPKEIFHEHVEFLFDDAGRPFHFLFYTTKPKYSQCLHDAAVLLETITQEQLSTEFPPEPLKLIGGRWCNKTELEEIFNEKLYDIEHEKFVEVFERLSEHPFAKLAEQFLMKYWKTSEVHLEMTLPKTVNEDGVTVVHIKE